MTWWEWVLVAVFGVLVVWVVAEVVAARLRSLR